jgi:RNase P/RNase MRP subunit p30
MTRRPRPSLLYAGPRSNRWFRAAVSNPDGDLLQHCVWQWKSTLAARVLQRPALRIPQYPLNLDPLARKPNRR